MGWVQTHPYCHTIISVTSLSWSFPPGYTELLHVPKRLPHMEKNRDFQINAENASLPPRLQQSHNYYHQNTCSKRLLLFGLSFKAENSSSFKWQDVIDGIFAHSCNLFIYELFPKAWCRQDSSTDLYRWYINLGTRTYMYSSGIYWLYWPHLRCCLSSLSTSNL